MSLTQQEAFYFLALSFLKGVGVTLGRQILIDYPSLEDFFKESPSVLRKFPWCNSTILESLKNKEIFVRAEKDLLFIEKNNITLLGCTQPEYPARLNECVDAPILLYYKGNTDLNRRYVLSVVGTRRPTSYGLQMCQEMMEVLGKELPDVLVCSGLAYGVDIATHREALRNGLDTVGVLAHGLDIVYPNLHRATANEMIDGRGGLLSEFPIGTEPERYNFVARNRIIAGMADATLVVESPTKGGSLITAAAAEAYNREVFAIPGRTIDINSAGCNKLINDNKAALVTSMEDILNALRWNLPSKRPVQRELFLDLTEEEEKIIQILSLQSEVHINLLSVETNIPIYRLSSLLLEMEMKGLVRSLPGCLYRNL